MNSNIQQQKIQIFKISFESLYFLNDVANFNGIRLKKT